MKNKKNTGKKNKHWILEILCLKRWVLSLKHHNEMQHCLESIVVTYGVE